jgi:hypothetical protein
MLLKIFLRVGHSIAWLSLKYYLYEKI